MGLQKKFFESEKGNHDFQDYEGVMMGSHRVQTRISFRAAHVGWLVVRGLHVEDGEPWVVAGLTGTQLWHFEQWNSDARFSSAKHGRHFEVRWRYRGTSSSIRSAGAPC